MSLIVEGFIGNKSKILIGISVTTLPTKVSYNQGDTLFLGGMIVTATYSSGESINITGYTTSPTNGSILSTSGVITVTVSYTENNITKTTSFNISVLPKVVTWAGGSDSEVAAMIQAAHNGQIKLADYWTVGDTRTVNLSAGTNSAGTEIPAQSVELILAHKPTNNSYYGGGEFIINQKNSLSITNYMNSSETNTGSFAGSAMASFLNNSSTGYLAMLPVWLRNVLLDAKVITAKTYNGTTNQISTHKVFLPAAKEIFGGTATNVGDETSYSNLTEFNALEQWEWFKTAANRKKYVGDSDNSWWWERSPEYHFPGDFCHVNTFGSNSCYKANYSMGVAPAMLI